MLYDIGSDVQMSFASRSRRFRPHRLRFELAFVRPSRKLNLLPKRAIEPRTGRASGQHRSTVDVQGFINQLYYSSDSRHP
jgi:hypothetical protein